MCLEIDCLVLTKTMCGGTSSKWRFHIHLYRSVCATPVWESECVLCDTEQPLAHLLNSDWWLFSVILLPNAFSLYDRPCNTTLWAHSSRFFTSVELATLITCYVRFDTHPPFFCSIMHAGNSFLDTFYFGGVMSFDLLFSTAFISIYMCVREKELRMLQAGKLKHIECVLYVCMYVCVVNTSKIHGAYAR